MKSLVMALFLFTTALSYALGEVLTPAITDPHLTWVWAGPAIAPAVQTVIFWCRYKHMNDDEFMAYDEQYDDHFKKDENLFEDDEAKEAKVPRPSARVSVRVRWVRRRRLEDGGGGL